MTPAGEVKRRIGIVGKVRAAKASVSIICCVLAMICMGAHRLKPAFPSGYRLQQARILQPVPLTAAQGVTFDCGGLNVKAGAGSMIEMMKFDMGGSGAALGAARALAALQPPGVEVPQSPWSTAALDAC